MTTTSSTAAGAGWSATSRRVARMVTELLSPIVQIVVVTLVVAVYAAGWSRGFLLGGLAVVFAGGIPYAVLLAGLRTGRVSDRHLTRREERPLVFGVGLVSMTVGFLVLRAMDTPVEVFALVVAMLAGVVITVAVSLVFKISVHTGCAGGSVAVLAVLISPWCLLLAPLAILVGWSRIVLEDHTKSEVIAGGIVGSTVAAAVCLLLT